MQKDNSPYTFPNNLNLNYEGKVPDYKFFEPKKVYRSEYNEHVNRFDHNWNFRTETLNYCNKDCISLHQVINNFAKLIFNKFSVDTFECPTLPSIALKLFRTKFLVPNLIPIIGKNFTLTSLKPLLEVTLTYTHPKDQFLQKEKS